MYKDIENTIDNYNEEKDSKIDWTKVWGRKYPILIKYKEEVDVLKYSREIRKLFNDLEKEYGYSELDAMLVLKDILAHEYMDNKK